MKVSDLKVIEQATLCDDGKRYVAYASTQADDHPDFEYTHKVFWDITLDDFENCDDQSNACNWDAPSEIVEL